MKPLRAIFDFLFPPLPSPELVGQQAAILATAVIAAIAAIEQAKAEHSNDFTASDLAELKKMGVSL